MSTLEFQQQLIGLREQLYWFAMSLTRDRENASDLLQDSLARALQFRDKFQDNTNFKAWVYTIMKNTFINDHRRGKRTRAIMDRVDDAHVGAQALPLPQSTDGRVRMGEIKRSLDRLDTMFREPFLMHHEGYKYEEIAEHMGVPIGTVKSRIFQARQRLMAMLTDKHLAN